MLAFAAGLCSLCLANAQTTPPHHVNLTVHVRDYCDPTTFNAGLGEGTCVRDTSLGLITLNGFFGEVAADKSVGAWRYAPATAQVDDQTHIMLQNFGGETHTFTRVKKFGGGFVAALNAASGNPTPAPECAQMVNGQLSPQPPSAQNIFIAAGTTATTNLSSKPQTVHYQCCIHPWMRLTVNVRAMDLNQEKP